MSLISSIRAMSIDANATRFLVLGLSCLVMAAAGSFATFAILADSYMIKFNLSFSDVNMISAVMNSALYICYLFVGPLYDRFGVEITQIVSAISYSLGYLLLYLSFIGLIPANAASLAIYYFIAGFGSCGAYMAMVGANALNFEERYNGLIGGILLLFYGLSGVIYAQIFQFCFKDNMDRFLLFILLSVFIINVLGALFVKVIPMTPLLNTKQNLEIVTNPTILASEWVEMSPSDVEGSPSFPGTSTDTSPTSHEGTSLLNSHQNTPVPISQDSNSLTPKQILLSPLFWSYAIATILQQGLTYMVNINAIIQSGMDPTIPMNEQLAQVSTITSAHVTVLAIGQSIGRFVFGAGSDIIGHYNIPKSVLLVVAQLLLFFPPFLFAISPSTLSSGILYFCSTMIGLGWGAGGGLFPPLTRYLFGVKFYGTASAFVMVGVPIGIFTSNAVFGYFYDQQGQINGVCYGAACFKAAFLFTTITQALTFVSACILVILDRKRNVRY